MASLLVLKERGSMGLFGLDEKELTCRLNMVRKLVAKPLPQSDPGPCQLGDNLYIGCKSHACDVDKLLSLGITAVLNCAPSGISALPVDCFKQQGIEYRFTNVQRDDDNYPILHCRDGNRSRHLDFAEAYYEEVLENGGKALFFCVAGQNRSATLAVAVLLLQRKPLQSLLSVLAKNRPFALENTGFQQQLVELEAFVRSTRLDQMGVDLSNSGRKHLLLSDFQDFVDNRKDKKARLLNSTTPDVGRSVVVELRVPGLCMCFDIAIPDQATVSEVKAALTERVDDHLASESGVHVGKSWLIFCMFGSGTEFDLLLEPEAIDRCLQEARLHNTFGLDVIANVGGGDSLICWNERCRFELIIFSIIKDPVQEPVHEPFTFRHQERKGVPGTLLVNNFVDSHLRAWDFCSGEGFRTKQPAVFSFSKDPRSKRDFVNVSTLPVDHVLDFQEPLELAEEGVVLGMGNNAIVHRVQLCAAEVKPAVERRAAKLKRSLSDLTMATDWDAAVKRPFSVAKMVAALRYNSEAGMAKRLRMAHALNRQGRLLHFHGLGLTVEANTDDRDEFKFEAVLLSRYQEDFSTYTLKQFLDDYTTSLLRGDVPLDRARRLQTLQEEFSLIQVKVLLESLLNAFRDLTLMGVQAFDFNHMNNVLISRDFRHARLIDIDGENKGSIQFPPPERSECNTMTENEKPCLDIELSLLLPQIVQQLLLGKGRGIAFVNQVLSQIRRAKDDEAKAIVQGILREDFFPALPVMGRAYAHRRSPPESGNGSRRSPSPETRAARLLCKLTEWLFAVITKKWPWTNWTNDIYDAMRCIDHLPIG